MRFLLIFGMIFTCFSHTCSNSVFAYFFIGRFSNVCTLSKHGIFKTHCFSRVKTLFWRNRLCRQPVRKCISWDGIVPCFLLNFHDSLRSARARRPAYAFLVFSTPDLPLLFYQGTGPRDPIRGPRAPRAPSAPLWAHGALGRLFRSHSEWKALSNGGLLYLGLL